jgi:hypothetical protein
MTLHPIPLNFLIYGENFILFFISAGLTVVAARALVEPGVDRQHCRQLAGQPHQQAPHPTPPNITTIYSTDE